VPNPIAEGQISDGKRHQVLILNLHLPQRLQRIVLGSSASSSGFTQAVKSPRSEAKRTPRGLILRQENLWSKELEARGGFLEGPTSEVKVVYLGGKPSSDD